MSAAPDVYVGPAFVGWRSWRILPFERLGESASVRLCASGRYGIPKVWEPGRATCAVCGKFKTTHEAPWPGCECGVYAYRTREAAEEHLESFRKNNGDHVLGWAFGRVSLWGRIVECELGWRAEYAYPYAIEVHAEPRIAADVRGLYGVDVEAHPPFPPLESPAEDEVKELSDRIAQVQADLAEIAGTPRAAKPRSVERLSDVVDYDLKTGRFRGESDRLGFLHRALWSLCYDHKPVTAREFAIAIMDEAGQPAYEPGPRESSELGFDLYRLAMRREIHRLRSPGRPGRYWSTYPCDGFDEDDPTLEHLAQDVPLVAAMVAAGGGGAVTTKQAMAELPAEIRPERSQLWSQAFVRCAHRGWIEGVPGRHNWKPTRLGEGAARLGGPPPELSADDLSLLLEVLRAAVADEGGPVTVAALNWRFHSHYAGGVGGHTLAQKLMRLEQRGMVTGHRQPNGKLVLWEPLKVEAA